MKKYTYDAENWSFKKSTVVREIKRGNRNLIILGILILAAVVFFDVLGTAYRARMYYSGAVEVSAAELAGIVSPKVQLEQAGFNLSHENSAEFDADLSLKRLGYEKDGSFYLAYTPERIIRTGIKTEAQKSAGYVYDLAALGDGRYMIFKRPAGLALDTLKGTVAYLPADMKDAFLKTYEFDGELIAPIFMDASSAAFSGLKTEIAFDAVILLIWGVWFFFVLRKAFNIELSEPYRQLYTCCGPVEENARAIDRELAEDGTYSARNNVITKNWILKRKLFGITIDHKDIEE